MNIVFFYTPYLDLVLPVIEELKTQGHDVRPIPDPAFPDCLYYTAKPVDREWKKLVDSFWDDQFNHFDSDIDIFISFNGISIDRQILRRMKQKFPAVRRIQYVWDSFNYLHLDELIDEFDETFTFDIEDARNTSGCRLLPSFYIEPSADLKNLDIEYDCFMIGTNHDNRYGFLKSVEIDLKKYGLSKYFRLYVSKPSLWQQCKDLVKVLIKRMSLSEFLFIYGYADKDLLSRNVIPQDAFLRYMAKSNIILDDNRAGQAGLSPRFIKAMALNKKIMTTNPWAHNYSFVDRENVLVIDKYCPVIDYNFMTQKRTSVFPESFKMLEIKNWVKILLGQENCPSFE